VSQRPADKTPRGRLRVLSDWLIGATPSPEATPDPAATGLREGPLPKRIGRYTITGKLGQGGMGVVYAARDERLERVVAVKTMKALGEDETARDIVVTDALPAGLTLLGVDPGPGVTCTGAITFPFKTP